MADEQRLLVETYRIFADILNGDPPYTNAEIREMIIGDGSDLIGRIYDTLETQGIEPAGWQEWEKQAR